MTHRTRWQDARALLGKGLRRGAVVARPLRTAARRRLLSLGLVEPEVLELVPLSGLAAREGGPGRWTATNDDPQFGVMNLASYSGSWVRLQGTLKQGCPSPTTPMLYLDVGEGFSEEAAVRLPIPSDDRPEFQFVFQVPVGLQQARLDPASLAGELVLGDWTVQPLDGLQAILEMVAAIGRTSHASVWWNREVLEALATGTLKDWILQRYREQARLVGPSYAEWIKRNEPPRSTWPELRAARASWPRQVTFSVLMPVYNPAEPWLRQAIESVLEQDYPHWELCVVDDGSTHAHVRKMLEEYAARDARIRPVFRAVNGHISEASNSGLEVARGEYVALLDHDDVLHPLALHWVAEALARAPDVGLVYTDEDKIGLDGRRHQPYFKSSFNYELFLAQNMVSHLGVYRRDLVQAVGGFRRGFEGSQDYDLALRVLERLGPAQVLHIPRVLYHWRELTGSTALHPEEKPYAAEAARRALREHLARTGRKAAVLPAPEVPSMHRTRFELPNPAPRVSIIIPTRDRVDLLRTCLQSIQERTSYPDYEVWVVDNGSKHPETLSYLSSLPAPRFRVIRDDRPFNYSALNNVAAAQASGRYLCLLNNDMEVLSPDWLQELVSFAAQPGVGAVGARLWYPNGLLQHAGVMLGLGGVAGHPHRMLRKGQPGYFGRAVLHQSLSAVTGACMVVPRQAWNAVSGLDERLAVAFNDVDFCLRLRDAGYRVVWTPYAELIHHESASRGDDLSPEKRFRFLRESHFMQQRWGALLAQDPAYSPNLDLENPGFELRWSRDRSEQQALLRPRSGEGLADVPRALRGQDRANAQRRK